MIIPVRCWSCGKPIAQLYEEFVQRVKKGESAKEVMDSLGLERYCCRSMFMGQIDLMSTVAQFKKS
ncbi:DNA-directed RNA polymerase subunit N [Candidatus Woesearchaeota archaeon]|nr:DNA-directed RNA polymerase subunit N [Candidatus Woesearchaeota archaeon]